MLTRVVIDGDRFTAILCRIKLMRFSDNLFRINQVCMQCTTIMKIMHGNFLMT